MLTRLVAGWTAVETVVAGETVLTVPTVPTVPTVRTIQAVPTEEPGGVLPGPDR
jgi:hypothetical protein